MKGKSNIQNFSKTKHTQIKLADFIHKLQLLFKVVFLFMWPIMQLLFLLSRNIKKSAPQRDGEAAYTPKPKSEQGHSFLCGEKSFGSAFSLFK